LSECRDAWCKRYGPTSWDTNIDDWGDEETEEQPKAKPTVVAKAKPANVNEVAPLARLRRF
jgi:hypothetical protein